MRKWMIFLTVSLLLVLMNVDMTAVNLALATIAKALHLNIANVQWIVSAYLIGGASMVMLGGLLGDIYGHKTVFLLGAVLFTAASLGVGLAVGKWDIIAMRLLQGFGAALAWPLAIVIVRAAFVSRESFALGLIAGVMGASMSIGPPLGGVILQYLGWRWIFFINIPIGLLVLLLGIIFLQKDQRHEEEKNLHLPSAMLLVFGLLLLMFALSEIQTQGLFSPLILSTLGVGLGLLSIFIVLQRRITTPLIDLKLFNNSALSSCFIVRFFWQLVWVGLFLMLSLLLQNILGYSALRASGYFLIASVAFACLSLFGGKLAESYQTRQLMIVAFLFYIAAFLGFALTTRATPAWQLALLFLLFGIGTGIGFPSLLNATLALAPANRRGMVSGILYATLFAGGSVGAVTASALIAEIAPKFLVWQLQKINMQLSQKVNAMVMATATGVQNLEKIKHYVDVQQAAALMKMAEHSFLAAFSFTLMLFIAIIIMLGGISWFIR